VIILVFFWIFIYTEIQEKRDSVEWKAFIHTGERFTAEDGARMRARIDRLEREIDELTGD
jgi:hypothetical protein